MAFPLQINSNLLRIGDCHRNTASPLILFTLVVVEILLHLFG